VASYTHGTGADLGKLVTTTETAQVLTEVDDKVATPEMPRGLHSKIDSTSVPCCLARDATGRQVR